MYTEKIDDPIGYLTIIRKAFPGALVQSFGNYDDENSAYLICPEPGDTILFLFNMERPRLIGIFYETGSGSYYERDRPRQTTWIFKGNVPGDHNNEIDLDFLKKILINYDNIG